MAQEFEKNNIALGDEPKPTQPNGFYSTHGDGSRPTLGDYLAHNGHNVAGLAAMFQLEPPQAINPAQAKAPDGDKPNKLTSAQKRAVAREAVLSTLLQEIAAAQVAGPAATKRGPLAADHRRAKIARRQPI